MIERVDVPEGYHLKEYQKRIELAPAVRELEAAARMLVPRLGARRVWMVNSAATGGGVAEMMPRVVSLLRQLGVPTEWAVIHADEPAFFGLTKRLHNMVHGMTGGLTAEDADLYARVSTALADELAAWIRPDDVLVVHDPQPLAAGALLKRRLGLRAVWRCHIGHDRVTPDTEAAWAFMRPWAEAYDRAVFSLSDYVPSFLAGRSEISPPTLDPLSHKNRELSMPKLVGILLGARLVSSPLPTVAPPFQAPALRLHPDGSFGPACGARDFGLLYRPVVVQVSRWDRLKGFAPLLEAFVRLKSRVAAYDGRHRRVLELVGLVLVGPDPRGVADDPEAEAVLAELSARWLALSPALQADVALLVLPMASRKENALIVNAVQRCATIVAQNSLREGFGLTATEAMWKGLPVLGTRAAGLAAQIRDGIDGRLVDDPADPGEIAERLAEMLGDEKRMDAWGANARESVHGRLLIFDQVERWLDLLAALR